MLSKMKAQAIGAVSVLIGLLFIGTMVYHFAEKWSYIQSFYFSVTTLTTVGYGDLYPTTDATRLFTAIYILSGVAITMAILSTIGAHYLKGRERKIISIRNNNKKNKKK